MIKIRVIYTYFLCSLALFVAATPYAYAQANKPKEEKPPVELRSSEPLFSDSLLMTPQDDIAINRALKGTEVANSSKAATEKREIRLAGLSYDGPYKWVLWLNGQRLVPGVTPPEIVELDVYPDYIHLKWFDAVSNEIIVIKLRPNQVYDIQSQILLPG